MQKRSRQVRDERGKEEKKTLVYTAVYKVNRSDVLLEFLLRKCNTSRNNVKALLARRQVLVNGSVVTQFDFPLAKDDEVKLSKTSVRDGGIAKRQPTHRARKKTQTAIKIIYEDADFIAIDKPVGLLSVESDKDTESAFSYVFDYLSEQGKNVRPYVLHRIDKETSGVLVFAKNPKIHSILKLHWNEYVTLREYFAVAEGAFEEKSGEIVSYLKENKNNLIYSTQDPSGQKAVTKYEVIRENEKYSLMKVRIETGRKNQIRVHMNDLGHTIVGDDKYGNPKDPLARLGLHAAALALIHPRTKKEMVFRATMPPAFYGLF